MGKLLSLWRRVGIFQKRDEHAKWAEEVSKQVDEGVASAVAGQGLFGLGDTINVGQNVDGSIVVNGDNIQVSPTIQAGAAAGATALQDAGAGLTEAPAGTVNVGQNADGSIVVNANDVQVSAAIQSGSAAGAAAAPVVTGSGISQTGGFAYMTQAPWFVNSTTGNDANDGATAGTPLLTLRELQRRFEGRISALTHVITLTGTFPTEPLVLNFTCYGSLTINATPTLAVAGITTAFTAMAAPATDAKLTDTTTPIVWTTHVGKRVRLTSGANTGAYAWVLKDLGANQARVSQFIQASTFASVAPVAGNTFAVETLDTVIGGIELFILGTGAVVVNDLTINKIVNTVGVAFAAGGGNNKMTLQGCRFDGASFAWGSPTSVNMIGCSNTATGILFFGRSAYTIMVAHASFGDVSIGNPYVLYAAGGSVFQACRLTLANGGQVDQAAVLAFFDVTGTNPVINLDSTSAVLSSATVFGIGNTTTGVGIRVRSSSSWVHTLAGNIPTLTAAGGDTSIGGTVTTYAAIAAAPQSAITNVNNAASIGLRS